MIHLGGIFATLGLRDTEFARAIDQNKVRLASLGAAAAQAGREGAHGLQAMMFAARFLPGPIGAAARAAGLAQAAFGLMGNAIEGVASAARHSLGLQPLHGLLAGGGLMLGIRAAEQSAAAYEASLVKLMKASNLTGQEFQGLRRELEELAATTRGVSLDDVISIATSLAKTGVAAEALRDQVAQMIMVAKAADDVPIDDLIIRLGSINSVAQLGETGLLQLGAAIDKLADTGISSFDRISATAARAIGTAKTVGVSTEQLLGMVTALLETGALPEATASGLNRFMQLLTSAETRKAIGDIVQLDGESLQRQLERPYETLLMLIEAFEKMTVVQRSAALETLKLTGVEERAIVDKLTAVVGRIREATRLAEEQFRQPTQAFESASLVDETALARRQQIMNRATIEMQRIGAEFSDLTTRVKARAVEVQAAILDMIRASTGDGPTLAEWAERAIAVMERLGQVALMVASPFVSLAGAINQAADAVYRLGAGVADFVREAPTSLRVSMIALGESVGNLLSGGSGMHQTAAAAQAAMRRTSGEPDANGTDQASIAAKASRDAQAQADARAAQVAAERAKVAQQEAAQADRERTQAWIAGIRDGMTRVAHEVGDVLQHVTSRVEARAHAVASVAVQGITAILHTAQDRLAIMGAPGRTLGGGAELARAVQAAIGEETQRIAERQLAAQHQQIGELRSIGRTLRDISSRLAQGFAKAVLG